jgi:hypothetical protein
MKTKLNYLLIALLSVSMTWLLSACTSPASQPTQAPPATLPEAAEEPAKLTEAAPAPTAAPSPTSEPIEGQEGPSVTVDISGVAQDVTLSMVAAVPPSAEAPWWESMPQHSLLTLQGYPVAEHLHQPQIFVYPVAELGINEAAGNIADSLQTLLQDQQAGQNLPYLPLYNAAQVMHAQLQFLDFKNGQGVRYLTQFDQGILPINNHELLYTYQGLTSDGKYYLAAVLPVTLPGLPADENVTADLPADFTTNFPAYLASTVDLLEQQPAGAFIPDLSQLDAMLQSIEIK